MRTTLILGVLACTFAGMPEGLAQRGCPKSFATLEIESSVVFPAQVNLRAIDPDTGFGYLVYPDFSAGHQKLSRIDLTTGQELAVLDLPSVPTSGSLLPSLVTVIAGGRIYLPGQPGIWICNVSNGQQVGFLGQPVLQRLSLVTRDAGFLYGYRKEAVDGRFAIVRLSDRAIVHVGAVPAPLASVAGLSVSPDGETLAVGLVDRVHLYDNSPPYLRTQTLTLEQLGLTGTGAAFQRLAFADRGELYVTATDQELAGGSQVSVSYLIGIGLEDRTVRVKPLPQREGRFSYLGLAERQGTLVLSDGGVYETDLPSLQTVGVVESPEPNVQHNNVVFTPDGNRVVLFSKQDGVIIQGFRSGVTFRINGESTLSRMQLLVEDVNRIEVCSAGEGGANFAVLVSTSVDRTVQLPGGQVIPVDPQSLLPSLIHTGVLSPSGGASFDFSIPEVFRGMVVYYTVITYAGSAVPPTRDELERIRSVLPRAVQVDIIANE